MRAGIPYVVAPSAEDNLALVEGAQFEVVGPPSPEAMRARDDLVVRNRPLCVSTIQSFFGWIVGTIHYEDCLQECSFGLMKASRRFDPSRGYAFSTYATWWIRHSVTDYLNATGLTSRKPDVCRGAIRLDAMDVADSSEIVAIDGDEAEVDGYLELESHLARLRVAMDRLPPRSRFILRGRFGIGGERGTLQEIGEQIGVTKERIRQIERQSIKALKKTFEGVSIR
jgi:RNA polymerase primary sigma factor